MNDLKSEIGAIKEIQADKADVALVKAQVEVEIADNTTKIEQLEANDDVIINNYGTKKQNYTTEIAFTVINFVLGWWRTSRMLKRSRP